MAPAALRLPRKVSGRSHVTPDSGQSGPSPTGPPTGSSAPPQYDRTLRLVLYDGVASETMSSLTTGVFLAGFAVELGATNLQIGALAAVPALTQLIQIPAVVLVERLRVRRRIAVISSVIGRT